MTQMHSNGLNTQKANNRNLKHLRLVFNLKFEEK